MKMNVILTVATIIIALAVIGAWVESFGALGLMVVGGIAVTAACWILGHETITIEVVEEDEEA